MKRTKLFVVFSFPLFVIYCDVIHVVFFPQNNTSVTNNKEETDISNIMMNNDGPRILLFPIKIQQSRMEINFHNEK